MLSICASPPRRILRLPPIVARYAITLHGGIGWHVSDDLLILAPRDRDAFDIEARDYRQVSRSKSSRRLRIRDSWPCLRGGIYRRGFGPRHVGFSEVAASEYAPSLNFRDVGFDMMTLCGC